MALIGYHTEESIAKQLKKLGDTCFELDYIEVTTDNAGFYSLKLINELRREAIRQLEDQIIASHGLFVSRQLISAYENENSSSYNNIEENHDWTVLVSNEQQLAIVERVVKDGSLSIDRIYA